MTVEERAVELLEDMELAVGQDAVRAVAEHHIRAAVEEERAHWLTPPVANCGHKGSDGCCAHPEATTPECHAGVACPVATRAAVEEAVKAERERCAKVADGFGDTINGPYTDLESEQCDERAAAAKEIAAAIRGAK